MPADRTEIMTIAQPCCCGQGERTDASPGDRCDQCGGRLPDESMEALSSLAAWESLGQLSRKRRAASDSLIGQRLGHFRIMSRLGVGGMGVVFRALDESLQRYVALKVIDDTREDVDNRRVARLLQEARAQARVNHPNVVHIYYVSRTEHRPFLAMELVHGPTLADRLRDGPLPFDEIIDIALQIVQALQQAALFDIVHGDIKPGNILLSDGTTVKLSDFGLAQRLSENESSRERIAGTPNYLSPEACKGLPTDIRSDMYALGVMLFEMTFGRLPYTFANDSATARIRAHCSAPVEFPERWPRHLPEAWRGLLARLLAKEPRERYWTYDVLYEDLLALKPVARPSAGRLVRGLAWVADIAIASALQRFLVGLFAKGSVGAFLAQHPWAAACIAVGGLAVPALITYLQARWHMSPGKELLQIRIVDTHGLTPRPSRLVLRSIWTMSPIWHYALQTICDAVGLGAAGRVMGAGILAVLGIDSLFGLVRRDRRTLHDLLAGTQVVLETESGGRRKRHG